MWDDLSDHNDAGAAEAGMARRKPRRATSKPFACQECGKRHTLASAERISYGNGRCACGGCDIDEA